MINRIRNLFTIKEFTGKHMLGVMFLFFGTIISVNLTLAWFAETTWSGLVAKNGYVESIDYDAKQKVIDKQKKMGWKSQVKLSSGHLVFLVKDKNGIALTGLKLSGKIGRPTTESQDQKLVFKEANNGEYIANVSIDKGQWVVAITAINADKVKYRKAYRLIN